MGEGGQLSLQCIRAAGVVAVDSANQTLIHIRIRTCTHPSIYMQLAIDNILSMSSQQAEL